MKRLTALAVLAAILVISACVTKDTEKPIVCIVQPANNDTLAPGNITIKAVATDNKEVTKVVRTAPNSVDTQLSEFSQLLLVLGRAQVAQS